MMQLGARLRSATILLTLLAASACDDRPAEPLPASEPTLAPPPPPAAKTEPEPEPEPEVETKAKTESEICDVVPPQRISETVMVIPGTSGPRLMLLDEGNGPPHLDFQGCHRMVVLDLSTGKQLSREAIQIDRTPMDHWPQVFDSFEHEGTRYLWLRVGTLGMHGTDRKILVDANGPTVLMATGDNDLLALVPKLGGSVVDVTLNKQYVYVLAKSGHVWRIDGITQTVKQLSPAEASKIDFRRRQANRWDKIDTTCMEGTPALRFTAVERRGSLGNAGARAVDCPRCRLEWRDQRTRSETVFLSPRVGRPRLGSRTLAVGKAAPGSCRKAWGADPPRLVLHSKTVERDSNRELSRVAPDGSVQWTYALGTHRVEGTRLTDELVLVRTKRESHLFSIPQLLAIELDTGALRWRYPDDSRPTPSPPTP